MPRLQFGNRYPAAVRRSRKRSLRVAMTTSVVLVLMVSGTASAATKSISTYWNPVWINGGSGSQVHFSAAWDHSKVQDAGKTWWWITNLEMTGTRQTACAGCTHSLAATAQFLTANNAVVATIRPPYGGCRSYYVNPGSVFFSKCATGPYQIGLSAVKIKFTWQFFTQDGWGWMHWTPVVTRTTAIN